jgi:hypothetical protein
VNKLSRDAKTLRDILELHALKEFHIKVSVDKIGVLERTHENQASESQFASFVDLIALLRLLSAKE